MFALEKVCGIFFEQLVSLEMSDMDLEKKFCIACSMGTFEHNVAALKSLAI
jgi:hypothetical protein